MPSTSIAAETNTLTAPQDLSKLFAPFFTTKPHGMGIGLAICRSIIEFHQGRLWVEPRREGGTRFRFTVPIEEDEDE
jgi:signal transduction histidine kinase